MKKFSWLIGIDEVGRGPLAGPVAVCAVAIPFNGFRKNSVKIEKRFRNNSYKKNLQLGSKKFKLSDSKKLSESERDQWFKILKNASSRQELYYALSYSSAEQIDAKGIAVCIRSLIKKNLKKLQKEIQFKNDDVIVLLDGSLKAPEEYINQETIIKGDEKEPVISFASIIAKVSRDSYMKKISTVFPEYAFEVHKGYGTLAHRTVIKKRGSCKLHRNSYLTRILPTKKG